jgi:hypothetical protein
MPNQHRSRAIRVLLWWMPLLAAACLFSANPAAGVTVIVATSETSAPAAASETGAAASPTMTPQPTATFTIVHQTTPPGATGTTRYITDFDTEPYAPQKKAIGGDEYFNNRWERPFTADTMDYLPDVDLKRVELRIAVPWVYVTFEFSEPRAEGIGQTMYGAEFDVNKDGRGDYLIWGASPPSGGWTTDGVEAWKDTNHDAGGPTPQGADAPWDKGDGYDRNLVAGGVGDDPDLAWIRRLEGGTKVQLAFKYSAIGNAAQFLWNGLADLGVRNPAWFDYNDHFTQAEAGSPLPVQTNLYPLKEIWGLDNTCRDAYGFAPTGTEPGLCLYAGSISGTVFVDRYSGNPPSTVDNGVLDANEPVWLQGTVDLDQGGCPGTAYQSATIGASGKYLFENIPIGPYCVRYSTTTWIGFYYTSPTAVAVTLTPGEAEIVNFGVDWTTPPA